MCDHEHAAGILRAQRIVLEHLRDAVHPQPLGCSKSRNSRPTCGFTFARFPIVRYTCRCRRSPEPPALLCSSSTCTKPGQPPLEEQSGMAVGIGGGDEEHRAAFNRSAISSVNAVHDLRSGDDRPAGACRARPAAAACLGIRVSLPWSLLTAGIGDAAHPASRPVDNDSRGKPRPSRGRGQPSSRPRSRGNARRTPRLAGRRNQVFRSKITAGTR